MARRLRSLVFICAIAVVGATAYGCSSSATPAASSVVGQPSQASLPAASVPASAAASLPAGASASAAPATLPAASGAPGDPVPAPTKVYKCSALISDAEMRSASGYAEAKSSGDDQSGELSGQTYCQFFTGSAGISIAVSVFTAGQGWDMGFLPLWKLAQMTPGVEGLSGIGDGAYYSGAGISRSGIALVSGHGITVICSDMSSGKLKGVDLKAQITKILTLVAGRV